MASDISKRIIPISPERRTVLDAFERCTIITGSKAPSPLPSHDWAPVTIAVIGNETRVRAITAEQYRAFLNGSDAQHLPGQRRPTLNYQEIRISEAQCRELAEFLKVQTPDGSSFIGRVAYRQDEPSKHAIPAGQITLANRFIDTRSGAPSEVQTEHLGIDLRHPEKNFHFNPTQYRL